MLSRPAGFVCRGTTLLPSRSTRLKVLASMPKNSIIWFRKGLRLHDNPALLEACRDAKHVYPIFIIDPHFLKASNYKVGVNRYNFLLESLSDLDNSFKSRGSRLLVMRGKPEEVLPKAFKDWSISQLCYEVDTEPYAKSRDAHVQGLAAEAGVEVKALVSHTLYDTEDLVRRNGGKPPLTMQSFTKLVDRLGDPPAPAADPPAQIPGPAAGAPGTDPAVTHVPTWQEMGYKDAPSTPFKVMTQYHKSSMTPYCVYGLTKILDGSIKDEFHVNAQGGETEALKRLQQSMSDAKWVAAFEKPQTDPSAFEKPATTVLSPYLKFGCLSPRLFHLRLIQIYRQSKKHSEPPVSLRGQLLWREFFYTVGAHTPNFHHMAGNSVCRQIDWQDNDVHLKAWKEGRTGFPWIDAIMTQLREWGWIHHLARHSVACFLTRGDLYISWEKGQEVFEEYLIDQDHFLNAGNWMWLSASAFFSQYFRVYSPISFGKKYDPDGKYIRRFLPVLKNMPAKYIYEPWTAPLEVQQRAGCIVGKDYPHPIVDHAVASKACIARIGAAYKAGKAAAAGERAEDEELGGAGPAEPAAGSTTAKSSKAKAQAASQGGGASMGAAASTSAAAAAAAAAATGRGRAARGAKQVSGEPGRAAKKQKTLLESGMTRTARKGDS